MGVREACLQLANLHWYMYSVRLQHALRLSRKGEKTLGEYMYKLAIVEFELSERYARWCPEEMTRL